MNIVVTPDDIKVGERGNCLCCPIAKAARRAGLETPSVDNGWIYFGPMKKRTKVALPARAREWIMRFDSEQEVGELSFDVDWEPS